jgi:hypothetical protein
MKSAVLWGLGALNVVLAVLLINHLLPSNEARAQGGARPSDYIMVPGQLQGIPTGVVFILDTSKGELSAMSYDDVNNTLSPMPKINLEQVFKAGASAAGGPNKVRPR